MSAYWCKMPLSNTEPLDGAIAARLSQEEPDADPMWSESDSLARRWKRRALRWSDALSARPVAGLVFTACLVAFGALIAVQGGQAVQATAVAHTPETLVETLLLTTVSAVHVKAGQDVTLGDVLMTLDSATVDRELETVEREIGALEAQLEFERLQGQLQTDRLALEIDQMERTETSELQLARSRRANAATRVEAAQKWRSSVAHLVTQGVESQSALIEAEQQLSEAKAERTLWATQVRDAQGRTSAPSVATFDAAALGDAQTRLTTARLEQLKVRRRHLESDAAGLLVRAPTSGRVSLLATVGARTGTLPSLATITPARASEVVAYLPPNLPAHRIPNEASTARLQGCASPLGVLRVGGSVRQAPGQVQRLGLQGPVFGLPVYLNVPADCALRPGSLAQVEIQP
jgi:multidrug resistance efflux pump